MDQACVERGLLAGAGKSDSVRNRRGDDFVTGKGKQAFRGIPRNSLIKYWVLKFMGEFQSLLQIPQHCFLYGDKDWSPRSGR